jgi:hemin uptake protein HemP
MNTSETMTTPRTRPPVNHAPAAPVPRPLPSAELLQGERSVEITHNGAIYRLQATRLGKLILTK